MNHSQQTTWIMVRSIGVIVLLFALTRVWPAVASARAARRFHTIASTAARSPTPAAPHEQTSPAVTQLVHAFHTSRAYAVYQIVMFLLALCLGLYCLRRGHALHRILMGNEEEQGPPNQSSEPTS